MRTQVVVALPLSLSVVLPFFVARPPLLGFFLHSTFVPLLGRSNSQQRSHTNQLSLSCIGSYSRLYPPSVGRSVEFYTLPHFSLGLYSTPPGGGGGGLGGRRPPNGPKGRENFACFWVRRTKLSLENIIRKGVLENCFLGESTFLAGVPKKNWAVSPRRRKFGTFWVANSIFPMKIISYEPLYPSRSVGRRIPLGRSRTLARITSRNSLSLSSVSLHSISTLNFHVFLINFFFGTPQSRKIFWR